MYRGWCNNWIFCCTHLTLTQAATCGRLQSEISKKLTYSLTDDFRIKIKLTIITNHSAAHLSTFLVLVITDRFCEECYHSNLFCLCSSYGLYVTTTRVFIFANLTESSEQKWGIRPAWNDQFEPWRFGPGGGGCSFGEWILARSTTDFHSPERAGYDAVRYTYSQSDPPETFGRIRWINTSNQRVEISWKRCKVSFFITIGRWATIAIGFLAVMFFVMQRYFDLRVS